MYNVPKWIYIWRNIDNSKGDKNMYITQDPDEIYSVFSAIRPIWSRFWTQVGGCSDVLSAGQMEQRSIESDWAAAGIEHLDYNVKGGGPIPKMR